MQKKKYNLRSTKTDTIQITLQVHLSVNNKFVKSLLGSENSNMSHQDSDSFLSGIQRDCSAIVQSDIDDAGTSGRSFNRL